jgi:hypothetical protein
LGGDDDSLRHGLLKGYNRGGVIIQWSYSFTIELYFTGEEEWGKGNGKGLDEEYTREIVVV